MKDSMSRSSGPVEHRRRFQTAFRPSNESVLIAGRTPGDPTDTVRGLLCRLRQQESQHTTDRASLQRAVQKEHQRAQRAEAAARRAQAQRDFRIGEAQHLKMALKRRDEIVTSLEDRVRELEIGLAETEQLQGIEGISGYSFDWYCTSSWRAILLLYR